MPLARISLRKGQSPAYRRTIVEGVYSALRAEFNVPEDDLFMVVDEYDESNFHYGKTFMGFNRSENLVIIQLTVANTRGIDLKRALYKAIAGNLERDLAIKGDDVMINLVEVFRENWSFGAGIAQYV